jgi:hypothetical protein
MGERGRHLKALNYRQILCLRGRKAGGEAAKTYRGPGGSEGGRGPEYVEFFVFLSSIRCN